MTTSALKSLGIRADVVIGPYRLRYTNLCDKLEFEIMEEKQCTEFIRSHPILWWISLRRN